jgi:hypothetical protein
MKKFFNQKVLIGVVCLVLGFSLGFLTNHLLTKTSFHSHELSDSEREERFPVKPEDFDHNKMLETFKNLQKDMEKDLDSDMQLDMKVTGVSRREDDKFVYFDIPLNASEKNHELKVSVKDGMISIKEMTPNSESERQFSIDPDLDDTKADVQTLKDKISIKIPKRK